MELFITITALSWFFMVTCIGNYLYKLYKINISFIFDILATAWLIKMVVQWAS